jgi:hypothetical protein
MDRVWASDKQARLPMCIPRPLNDAKVSSCPLCLSEKPANEPLSKYPAIVSLSGIVKTEILCNMKRTDQLFDRAYRS